MAYQPGSTIEASNPSNADYNEIASLINEVYGDIHSGNYDNGVGDYGYGQTPEIALVAPGTQITAAQWNALYGALADCAVHQGTAVGYIPASVVAGQTVQAYTSPTNLITLIDQIKTNRLNIAAGQAQVTSGGSKLSNVYSTPWTEQVVYGCEATFASGDDARHFFNAGGEIHITMSYVPGLDNESGEETQWRDLFDQIGTVRFGASTTTLSGTPSPGAGVLTADRGYYDIGLGSSDFVLLEVVNSGIYSGSERVEITVTMLDNYARLVFTIRFYTESLPDRVLNGELTCNIDQKRSINRITTLEPTYTFITFNGT